MATDLALTRPEPLMDRDNLRTLMDQAVRYVESGLLPNSIKTPQQALIIMAQGRELGIPSTVALRGIVVVQGKPTCSAELMMALVHRTYGQSAMRVFKTDNDACTIQYRQQGWDGVSEYTFSMEDARRANLLKNPTWNQYPAAMLRARAISATVRFAFPECISGLYTPDELGAPVTVVDGEVVPGQHALDTGHGVGCKAIARNRPDACDCGAREIADAAPPSDFQDGTPFCDVEHFRKAWHAAVKGTRFEDDQKRHLFIGWHTKGTYDSLTAFLKGSTTEEAACLLAAVERVIEVERKKARADLVKNLQDVIDAANAGDGKFAMPEAIADWSDDDISEFIMDIHSSIATAPAASA